MPSATDQCGGAAATVTATIIKWNGATTSIPVTNGTVALAPGSGVIQFVATNPNGVTTTATQNLTVEPPPTLYGLNNVTLADGAAAVQGALYDGAGGKVFIGNDSIINNIYSLSPVQLHDRSTTGDIYTNAGFSKGNGDNYGTLFTTVPSLPTFPQLSATFTGTSPIIIFGGTSQSLTPGQYGKVTVYSSGKLVLSAGSYYFTALDFEPQAQIVEPSTNEAVKVFVRDSVIYRGSTVTSGGSAAPLYLGYTGTSAFSVESAYLGTLIAPNTQVTLQTLNGQSHQGEFFAKGIVVAAHAQVVSKPLSCGK
jgi:hypothetical protein